jgi:phosphoribosylanthranilate isomerase
MNARVKVCGITRSADALRAVELGAAILGLNFYPRSPRFVPDATAEEIAAAVRGQVKLAGVFVNSTADEVEELDRRLGLDLLQFHGDESPGFIARFGARALPAVRWRDAGDAVRVREHSRAWGVLVERRHSVLYGGTGEEWNYAEVAPVAREVRLLLAGGLGPDNVREAVTAASPWGVDVCSRIESAPGVKDAELMRRFFEEVA